MLKSSKESKTLDQTSQNICNHLQNNGFRLFAYYGVAPNIVFVLIKAPMDLMKSFADEIEFALLLDKDNLKKAIETGDRQSSIKGVTVNDDRFYCRYSPFEYIYGAYRWDNEKVPDSLYWRPGDSSDKTPFRTSVRLKLIALLLERVPPGRCRYVAARIEHPSLCTHRQLTHIQTNKQR